MAKTLKKAKTVKKSKFIHVGFTAPMPLVIKVRKQAKKLGVSRAAVIRNTLQANL